ncbi:ATP-grasp domain-containing protein [Pseudoprevotella muciniphila]|uniref:ATP-grasp domain-containing protein n=1 Tax=Pseudoprevotella muciniphila TaxID=2133944 RepID=A0A5P8E8R4_9BACT|nr:ATP-grasp domain-containing protein [Pseudoprevotella muciniphila]QFQ13419.1 ATP-grasp domain-containing protein [Pseudoprevotella muciniphila]
MGQKKLMLLGGLRYLKPVIDAAHNQGYYVITADYIPNNIAHKWSDEYCNVSIIDKEAVLREAQRLKIDGIMSFACDPGVIAASYVQNKMHLPSFGSFESVEILQNKDKFREFLAKNGFNVPQAKGFDSVEDAMQDVNWCPWPVIVKPTDAAGSKGVSRVDTKEDLRPALEYAMEHSISGHIIIEEFIEKQGCSSDTDSMSVDGKLVFTSFCAQRFDAQATNPYTPAAYSWPSTFTKEQEEYLTSEIQRLITLLNLKTVVYNIETRVAPNGKPYIMELTPRGGGNRLCEMLRYATGVDMITAITRAIVGDPILETIEQKPYNGHWAEIILHADQSGLFDHIEISKDLPAEIVEEDLWVKKGDRVETFEGANNAIGTLVLKFQTAEELEKAITNQHIWLKVVVK